MQTTKEKNTLAQAKGNTNKGEYLRHLKTLPALSAANISAITKLPRHLQFMGLVETVKSNISGKKINSLRAYAAIADYRDLAVKLPTLTKKEKKEGKVLPQIHFVSLEDDEREGCYGLHERLAAIDPADLLDARREEEARWEALNKQSERLLEMLPESASELGRNLGLTARAGQYILNRNVKNISDANKFKVGNKDSGIQGALFEFGGVV